MNLPDSLLRPILERPFSGEPRLVAADWLDEHGEPERADFIRFQITEGRSASIIAHASPCCTIPFRGSNWGIPFNLGMEGMFTIERGFPSSVSLPLSRMVGGECGRCEDSARTGHVYQDCGPYESGWLKCEHCHGTGRVNGIAAELANWPIVEVQLTDREPRRGLGFEWFRTGGSFGEFKSELPDQIFNRMQSKRGLSALFDSRESAIRKLSQVCVDLIRDSAEPKLPAIQWPK